MYVGLMVFWEIKRYLVFPWWMRIKNSHDNSQAHELGAISCICQTLCFAFPKIKCLLWESSGHTYQYGLTVGKGVVV